MSTTVYCQLRDLVEKSTGEVIGPVVRVLNDIGAAGYQVVVVDKRINQARYRDGRSRIGLHLEISFTETVPPEAVYYLDCLVVKPR